MCHLPRRVLQWSMEKMHPLACSCAVLLVLRPCLNAFSLCVSSVSLVSVWSPVSLCVVGGAAVVAVALHRVSCDPFFFFLNYHSVILVPIFH